MSALALSRTGSSVISGNAIAAANCVGSVGVTDS
jgi:hypothetical protein